MLILTVLQGPDKGKVFELPDNEPQMIGRSSEALPLTDQTISRRHAELTPDNGRWYIRDLHSGNGTYINGKRARDRRHLCPGDQIRTGATLFVFGMDEKSTRRHGVRVAKPGEMAADVEMTAAANEQSMIMAVPDPSEAAIVQLKVVYELTELIATEVDRNELLERVMDLIFDYFQADRGFILLQGDPGERPDPVVVRHRQDDELGKKPQITISRTIVQHVIKKGEAVLSSNAMTDVRFAGGDSVQGLGIRSALCAPIKYKERIFGVIHIDSQIANYTFTEDQLKLIAAIGVHTGLALANAEMYHERLDQERLVVVGQTVASLAHSIKNILQGMRGGADVVELGLKKQKMNVVQSGWNIVCRNLDRIIQLTMNMLTFSKQRHPDLEMQNINTLLEEIINTGQEQFDRQKVALIADLDETVPPVAVDASGIHQALLNLLSNALDAVEPETGIVTVRCDYVEDKQCIRIRVTDNGQGIHSDRLKHLFQPFRSTKGQKGTGLGLVVTKKIVEEHGGTVHVESTRDSGSTFTIMLPVINAQAATMDDTVAAHAPKPG